MKVMITKHPLSQEEIHELQQHLLGWFATHQRSFPWRETREPFHILVAEKLLQQTSVGERVVTAYLSIISKFPNPDALANAQPDELLELVAPLGLQYRARELIQLALAIQNQFLGEIPRNYKKLIALPGVGEYTARAILSFAYGEDIAIVDTNVARFLFRIVGIDLPMPANPARKKYLVDLATAFLPDGKSRDFNFAVLDLCATICKAQNPICNSCPVNTLCFYSSTTFKRC